MNRTSSNAFLASALSVALLAGCASPAPAPSAPKVTSVPSVQVVVDCGKCEVPASVLDAIRTSYADAATKANTTIASDSELILKITEYHERSMGLRLVSLVAGPLAMALKDEIKAVAMFNGKAVPVEYTYRLPFFGISSAAQHVGELSFEAAARN